MSSTMSTRPETRTKAYTTRAHTHTKHIKRKHADTRQGNYYYFLAHAEPPGSRRRSRSRPNRPDRRA